MSASRTRPPEYALCAIYEEAAKRLGELCSNSNISSPTPSPSTSASAHDLHDASGETGERIHIQSESLQLPVEYYEILCKPNSIKDAREAVEDALEEAFDVFTNPHATIIAMTTTTTPKTGVKHGAAVARIEQVWASYPRPERIKKSTDSLLTALEPVEHILKQLLESTPEVSGFDIPSMVWGGFVFALKIARHNPNSYGAVLDGMKQLAEELSPSPASTNNSLASSSSQSLTLYSDAASVLTESSLNRRGVEDKRQLVREPIMAIHVALIRFGIKTVEHLCHTSFSMLIRLCSSRLTWLIETVLQGYYPVQTLRRYLTTLSPWFR
jgi:hypothetical protein